MTEPRPLNAEEEAEIRRHLDPTDAYQYGGWAHLVARLLATLDAARAPLDVERLARAFVAESDADPGNAISLWDLLLPAYRDDWRRRTERVAREYAPGDVA